MRRPRDHIDSHLKLPPPIRSPDLMSSCLLSLTPITFRLNERGRPGGGNLSPLWYRAPHSPAPPSPLMWGRFMHELQDLVFDLEVYDPVDRGSGVDHQVLLPALSRPIFESLGRKLGFIPTSPLFSVEFRIIPAILLRGRKMTIDWSVMHRWGKLILGCALGLAALIHFYLLAFNLAGFMTVLTGGHVILAIPALIAALLQMVCISVTLSFCWYLLKEFRFNQF